MLKDVVRDLQVFLFFFTILLIMLAMTLAVLGLGNENVKGKFQEYYRAEMTRDPEYDGEVVLYHGSEYRVVGKFFGYVLTLLRISLGDFGFESSQYLEADENHLFWVLWLLMVFITCIIFLNFIIAETGKSYGEVDERATATIAMERAMLCAEAETAAPTAFKDAERFP